MFSAAPGKCDGFTSGFPLKKHEKTWVVKSKPATGGVGAGVTWRIILASGDRFFFRGTLRIGWIGIPSPFMAEIYALQMGGDPITTY